MNWTSMTGQRFRTIARMALATSTDPAMFFTRSHSPHARHSPTIMPVLTRVASGNATSVSATPRMTQGVNSPEDDSSEALEIPHGAQICAGTRDPISTLRSERFHRQAYPNCPFAFHHRTRLRKRPGSLASARLPRPRRGVGTAGPIVSSTTTTPGIQRCNPVRRKKLEVVSPDVQYFR
jgi:hypothetical protein